MGRQNKKLSPNFEENSNFLLISATVCYNSVIAKLCTMNARPIVRIVEKSFPLNFRITEIFGKLGIQIKFKVTLENPLTFGTTMSAT